MSHPDGAWREAGAQPVAPGRIRVVATVTLKAGMLVGVQMGEERQNSGSRSPAQAGVPAAPRTLIEALLAKKVAQERTGFDAASDERAADASLSKTQLPNQAVPQHDESPE
jgi:hypothetical protein